MSFTCISDVAVTASVLVFGGNCKKGKKGTKPPERLKGSEMDAKRERRQTAKRRTKK